MRYVVILFLIACGCSAPRPEFRPVEPTAEYRDEPLGMETRSPRFAWRMETDLPCQEQTAYRIVAATSKMLLDDGRPDLWDSGKVASNRSALIPYEGKPLKPDQDVFWKILTWNGEDYPGQWSRVSRFSTGPADDWEAQWIGADKDSDAPWLRKDFHLLRKPVAGRIHVCSFGYHELYINGTKVGEDVLNPVQDGRHVTYDVSRHLVQGRNAIALWLGRRNGPPHVMAQMCVRDADGRTTRVVTDTTWKTSPSPIQLREGERYDATKWVRDWNRAQFDDRNWKNASLFVRSGAEMRAQIMEPRKLKVPLEPASVERLDGETWRVDMGRLFTGRLQVEFPGEYGRGQVIELDNGDGYVALGRGREIFANRFMVRDIRQVKIKGLTDWLDRKHVLGFQVNLDYKPAGSFTCSSDALNEIYQKTRQTFDRLALRGLVAYPESGLYSYGLGAFLTEWLTSGQPALPTAMAAWEMYMHFGDERILKQVYPRLLEQLREDDSASLAGRCRYLYALELFGGIAEVIGRSSDTDRIEALKGKLHKEHFDPRKNRYGSSSPVMPLVAGVVPEYLVPRLLREEPLDAGDDLPLFLVYLMKEEHHDLIQELALNSTSLSQESLLGLGAWCIRGIGGIRYDPAHPGFQRFIIKPAFIEGLQSAVAAYRSPYGRIESRWKVEGDALELRVTVPPNSEASVFIPRPMKSIEMLEEGPGQASFLQNRDGHSIYRVKSGSCRFLAK